jgi:hypothetical protein
MKSQAVAQAVARLSKGASALAVMASPIADISEQEAAWIDFLLAFVGVYNKLWHGTKDAARSRQWMGTKKRERAADPLLSYLNQARNADEHGIEPSTASRSLSLSISPGGLVKFICREDGVWDWSPIIGTGTPNNPRLYLVPVTDDRFGTVFPVPQMHLGLAVTDKTAAGVAALGLAYLGKLVSEADAISRKSGAQVP